MSCQARACMPTIRPCRCSPRVRSGRRRGGCGRICDTGGPLRGDVAPAVLHRYNPDRKSDHPRLHLAGFTGVLHADGYSGFATQGCSPAPRSRSCRADAGRRRSQGRWWPCRALPSHGADGRAEVAGPVARGGQLLKQQVRIGKRATALGRLAQ